MPDEPAAGGAGGPSPVPPGTGWPDDPATSATPVAAGPADVRALAATAGTLAELAARQSVCRACPRLVGWREQVAAEKRRSFAAERYWGRPVPGWGAEQPGVLIVGLAPAAHGGNRTGRIFTGDRSGDFLFASLWRCGLAAVPASVAAGDGQQLLGVRMAAAVRCAPPANKPSVAERDTCAPWLTAELAQVRESVRVIVCLGHFAWQAIWPQLGLAGFSLPRPRPAFGHGAEVRLERTAVRPGSAAPGPEGTASGPEGTAPGPEAEGAAATPGAEPPGAEPPGAEPPGAEPPGAEPPGAEPPGAGAPVRLGVASGGGTSGSAGGGVLLLGCYHPSQQNTFTGRVTEAMLDAVFQRAREQAGL